VNPSLQIRSRNQLKIFGEITLICVMSTGKTLINIFTVRLIVKQLGVARLEKLPRV
jgi:hypothetical protein